MIKTNDINPPFPSQFKITVASNDQSNQFSDNFFIMKDVEYFKCFYVDIEPYDNEQKTERQKEMETLSPNSVFIPTHYNDINQVLPIHFINFFLFMYAFRDYIKIEKDFHKTGKFLFYGKEMSVNVVGIPFAGIETEVRNEIFREFPLTTIEIYCRVYWQEIFLLLLVIGPVLWNVVKYAKDYL